MAFDKKSGIASRPFHTLQSWHDVVQVLCETNIPPRHREHFLEPTIFGFDRPLLYRLSYKARRAQVVSDYRGNGGNVNVVRL